MFLRFARYLLKAAQKLSAILAFTALTYLAFVVATNIVARTIFDFSGGAINFIIPAAIEQTSLALGVLVFAAIGASLNGAMISVDIFTTRIPKQANKILNSVWMVLLACVFVTLAWLFMDEALVMMARGDATQDLRLPMHIFYWIATVQCLAITIIALGSSRVSGEVA